MGIFIDRTGKRYGRLLVISQAEHRNRKVHWLCRCDCGKEVEVSSGSLATGNTKGCGCIHPKRSTPPEVRFWDKVKKSDGCWKWIGARDAQGYGIIRLGKESGFKNSHAHRLSWMIHFGEIGDACVLHKCDNPECVNPNHLFLGTLAENSADMAQKGRACRGERHPLARLNAEKVHGIRQAAGSGLNQFQIARIFSISQPTVSSVLLRKTWRHVQ